MRYLPICLLATTSLFAGTTSAQSPTTVLFVGDARITAGADAAILTYLNTRYGKANVTYLDTEPNGVTSSQVLGHDVVVLSSTPFSGRYRNILHNSPAPIVNFEEAVAGNNGAGEFAVTMGRTKETEVDHSIVITTKHAITNGFSVNSSVKICAGSAEVWWSTGMQATGAASLAADDDTATNMFVTYVEAGGNLLNNTKTPCRRVMFGLTDASFKFFTADGKKLFGQAVDWAAAGCCAQTSNYGQGLAGTNGIPTLTTNARPVYGTTVNILMSNSSGVASVGLIVLSQTRASVPFLGGTLLTNPTFLGYVTLPAGGLTLPAPIPDLSALCPVVPHLLVFYVQLLQIDSAAPAGVSFSPGMRLEIGR
jgi:hypothetical protein